MFLVQTSVIVIGRNEGQRLVACLESLCGYRAIYVDSASTDGSVELARSLGADVVKLDMSRPFSAARARNEGFLRLREITPGMDYLQFVDGDCVVMAGWVEAAASFLDQNSGHAAVAGRLRERFPDRSVYNRLCDLEWNTPVGDVSACGGIAMYRVDAFEKAGGFDETVVAGEEPELCLRLRNAGWKIRRLDVEMALHDAAMTRFGQWWKRAVRGGYGGMDVAVRFEKGEGAFSRQVSSARLWAVGWPLVVLAITGTAWALGGWRVAGLTAVLTLAALPMQMARVGVKGFRKCGDARTAVAYGVLMMLSKWAHLQGQYRYWRDRREGRCLSLIEYKRPADKDAVAHV